MIIAEIFTSNRHCGPIRRYREGKVVKKRLQCKTYCAETLAALVGILGSVVDAAGVEVSRLSYVLPSGCHDNVKWEPPTSWRFDRFTPSREK
jgi:hypothetical protein